MFLAEAFPTIFQLSREVLVDRRLMVEEQWKTA
jgi:hypothetical protein